MKWKRKWYTKIPIGKNAFSGCTKLNSVTIQKLFKGKGQGKKVKIKKY